jgi:hypothetical protein
MFLSRTVAAEVCMECRVNDAGYIALKQLDADGALLFNLKDLVNDLLQVSLFMSPIFIGKFLHLSRVSSSSRPVQSRIRTQSIPFKRYSATFRLIILRLDHVWSC